MHKLPVTQSAPSIGETSTENPLFGLLATNAQNSLGTNAVPSSPLVLVSYIV